MTFIRRHSAVKDSTEPAKRSEHPCGVICFAGSFFVPPFCGSSEEIGRGVVQRILFITHFSIFTSEKFFRSSGLGRIVPHNPVGGKENEKTVYF